jgi:hypothetical protein
VIRPPGGKSVPGLETGLGIVEPADDSSQKLGIRAAWAALQELPGLAAVQLLVGCQGLRRKRSQPGRGKGMSTAGDRLGFKPDKHIVVTIENRLQLGYAFDQPASVQVFLGGTQTNFDLPFANEVLMPLIEIV